MTKLKGNIRITTKTEAGSPGPVFDISFVPYHGRINGLHVQITRHDDLVQYLISMRISDDEASRWAGRARSEGVVLIPEIERSEAQLREYGLMQ
jgi:hypothetical protein